MCLFSLLTLLRLVLCKHFRSIKWQYPVPIELLLQRPPRPDLAGNTAQVADLSSMQVRHRALLLCALLANGSRHPRAALSFWLSRFLTPRTPSTQIQVFDHKRRLILTRNVGRDAVFRDNNWTAVEVCARGPLVESRVQSCLFRSEDGA